MLGVAGWRREGYVFEYHGWVAVRASAEFPEDGAFDKELTDEAQAAIRALVEPLASYGLMQFQWMNVGVYIHMAAMPNHGGTQGELIIDLFTRVGALAPGSYGLLYVYDDEDRAGLSNEFQVYRMVRGAVTREADPFLSPVIPTLEDPTPDLDPE